MKSFLILSLALVSVSSYAHGIKRLTTTTCESGSDTQIGAVIEWDSSVSPIGPKKISINAEEVKRAVSILFGDDATTFSGVTAQKENFEISVSKQEESETVLKIGESEIPLACHTVTKFRLF
jgi:hypothetical protein